MCDTPKTVKQAISRFKELDDNVKSRKKAFDTASAKLTVAKKLILDDNGDKSEKEGYVIDGDGFTINASKARATTSIADLDAVCDALNAEEEGLADKLKIVSFSMADLKANLSARQLDKLMTAPTYGARTFAVKVPS